MLFSENRNSRVPQERVFAAVAGRIPGVRRVTGFGWAPAVMTVPVDVWPDSSLYSWPIGPESWEVVSSSADDFSTRGLYSRAAASVF